MRGVTASPWMVQERNSGGERQTREAHTKHPTCFPSSQKKPVSEGLQARSGHDWPARHQRGSISHLTPGTHLGRPRPNPYGFRSHQTGREHGGNTLSQPATGPPPPHVGRQAVSRVLPEELGPVSRLKIVIINRRWQTQGTACFLRAGHRPRFLASYIMLPGLSMTASVRKRYCCPRFTRKRNRDAEGITDSPKVTQQVTKWGFEPRGLQDSKTRALNHWALNLAKNHHCDFSQTF